MVDCRICANREESPICSECKNGSNFEKEIFTNADRIRAMDVEELAKFLDATVHTSAENLFSCDERKCTECENCYLEWLKSEAE